jgi:hypothetical protein
MATTIYSFTKGGQKVAGAKRPGVATSPLGKLDTTTGVVWQRPQLSQNPLAGSSVTVSNPKASTQLGQNSMTASLGVKGVGQRGRNRDVGSTKAPGEA